MNKILITSFMLLAVSGCTNENLYNSFQPDKSDCRKLPTQQREECKKSVDEQMPYKDYKKQRESL